MMQPMSAEATVVRNYIDWVLNLPWQDKTEENYDLDLAERDPRRGPLRAEEGQGAHPRVPRGAGARSKKLKGPVLCLVGPPRRRQDQSLARSIARSTGRKFVRLSLGGVRDEAEIRGHRRTYIGALPGRIIQSLRKVGTNNPVLPAGRGRQDVERLPRRPGGGAPRGPWTRSRTPQFNDHYLDLDYDLSGRHVHHDGEPP